MDAHALEAFVYAEFIRKNMCSLCGNIGVIDTRATAVSAAGTRCGDVHFCICSNGRAQKQSGGSASEWLQMYLQD